MNRKARVLAFYLPQFHPIPENDRWWGKGFTEWTNVGKAKSLFRGHYQPRVPADLGYYDLRMPEVRQAQADMAREAGIEGFCYWHYWFGDGRQILERPFSEVLKSGKPDFPFCLAWANESWTNKSWHVGSRKMELSVLMEQRYSEADDIKHFEAVLPAFRDPRYVHVDGKPLFVVYRPWDLPDVSAFIKRWQELANKNGIPGIYFVAVQQNYIHEKDLTIRDVLRKSIPDQSSELYPRLIKAGFDAVNSRGYHRAEDLSRSLFDYVKRFVVRNVLHQFVVSKCSQKKVNKYMYVERDRQENVFPTLLPCWDRTPRSGKKARIYVDSTPEEFDRQMQTALSLVKDKEAEHRILFLQSWNEWAEGNYVEPDLKYGHGFLDVLKKNLINDECEA